MRPDVLDRRRLILLGQPTLRRRLKLGQFAALDQRIALRASLDGLPPDETAASIRHHLALAGRNDTLFSDDATAAIHAHARGIPRAINNLAVQALIAAFAVAPDGQFIAGAMTTATTPANETIDFVAQLSDDAVTCAVGLSSVRNPQRATCERGGRR